MCLSGSTGSRPSATWLLTPRGVAQLSHGGTGHRHQPAMPRGGARWHAASMVAHVGQSPGRMHRVIGQNGSIGSNNCRQTQSCSQRREEKCPITHPRFGKLASCHALRVRMQDNSRNAMSNEWQASSSTCVFADVVSHKSQTTGSTKMPSPLRLAVPHYWTADDNL